MTKKRAILGIIFWVIIIGAFFGLARLHKMVFPKTSVMPAEKSVPTAVSTPASNNPIIGKVLQMRIEEAKRFKELKEEKAEEFILVEKLENIGIRVWVSKRLSTQDSTPFLQDLLADKEFQKIFRQFSKADIIIRISDFYNITSYGVWVDGRDGVEKVFQWLKNGKVK